MLKGVDMHMIICLLPLEKAEQMAILGKQFFSLEDFSFFF